MDELRQDIQYGLRTLARRPGFTAVAALSLALGTGANVAVFTIVNAVLLNPLPVDRVDELVNLYTTDSTVDIPGFTMLPFSYRNYEDVRELNEVFSEILKGALRGDVLSGSELGGGGSDFGPGPDGPAQEKSRSGENMLPSHRPPLALPTTARDSRGL